MRLPALDERLSAAAQMMPACAYGADIGADHGRLSCYLLANAICDRMCVADLSGDSLQKAIRLLTLHGFAGRADFRIGNGLSVLPRRAEAIAILGMGGCTAAGIIRQGAQALQGAALVLSAHTDVPYLRETLMQLSYRIAEEQVVSCAGRFYIVLKALPGYEPLDEKQLLLGPRLTEAPGSDAYRSFIQKKLSAALCRQDEAAKPLIQHLREECRRVSVDPDD